MIENPKFKGPWKAKRISNPAYKGEWTHPDIDNPEYFEDKSVYLYKDISMVAIDLWQVKAGTIFDNILVADSKKDADEVAARTFAKLKTAEKKAKEEKDKADAEAAKASTESAKTEDKKEDDDEDKPEHDEL